MACRAVSMGSPESMKKSLGHSSSSSWLKVRYEVWGCTISSFRNRRTMRKMKPTNSTAQTPKTTACVNVPRGAQVVLRARESAPGHNHVVAQCYWLEHSLGRWTEKS